MKSSFNDSSSNTYSDVDMTTSGVGFTTMSTKASSRIFQPIQLNGVELPVLSRYAVALGFLIFCIIVLLWSRLDLRETRVSLSQAHTEYKSAIEEQHRLQLELDSLLAPSSIRNNIQNFDFTAEIDVIEITESSSTINTAEEQTSSH
jgi:hypothetical protein